MAPWTEPGWISYQRRAGSDPVLEPLDLRRRPGEREFIMVCGMGSKVMWIRQYARTAEEARAKFYIWLAEPWQTLTTDFSGAGVTNGLDFKPSRIEWFNIAE